jgi:ribosomal protein S12 methylthiotransferase
MKAQQAISARNLRKKVGQRVQVIVDEATGRTGRGRTRWDAPEIDGSVNLNARLPIRAGEIVTARITASSEYDLTGDVA